MAQALTKPSSAETLYREQVQALPAAERLRLATLILNDIPREAVVDYSTEWNEEDLRDFSDATFNDLEERELEEANAATR